MARPLRIEYEGAIYHVTARGNERGKIFSHPPTMKSSCSIYQRKIAICLMKERTGAHNKQIGEYFGRTSKAVGKSYERFRREIKRNKKLGKEIKRIERALSFVEP